MFHRRKALSDSEKVRRTRQREQALAAVEPLLYSRKQTAKILGGISIATVQRLEGRGFLDKVRLAGSGNGAVFHRASQVHALAAGAAAEPKNDSPSAAQTIAPDATARPKPVPKSKRRAAGRVELEGAAE